MLSNCENMVVISSTAHEWPPQNHIDEKDLMASTARLVEKPCHDQQQQQQQQQALKCPRCDSSNTKFCYYNNYSFSQPRHFCKACKRYWTRGGTLRNVPVGGGCRKNKRVKKPAASAIDGASSASGANPNTPSQPQIDVSSTSRHHISPLFYGLANNPSDINLPFPRFNSRVSGVETVTGYDLQPQLNALELGFSSGIVCSDTEDGDYRNGFNANQTKQIQDVVTSNPLLSSYSNILGSSSSSTTTTPTIASLLDYTIHQHKFMSGGVKNTQPSNQFQAFAPFQDLQMTSNTENGLIMKDIKVEEAQSRMEWNVPCQNQLDQIALSDPAVFLNTTSVGAWHDQANIGSSVTSLI